MFRPQTRRLVMTVHAAPTTESILYNDCRAIGESESSLTK